jgi:hypothetical protein
MTTNDRRTCGPPNALEAALVANLSPEGIAAIICFLQAADGPGRNPRHTSAIAELRWFGETLLEILGVEEYDRVIDEIGL